MEMQWKSCGVLMGSSQIRDIREIRGFQHMETVSQKFPYFSMAFPGSFHLFPCVVERRMFVVVILRLNRAMTAVNQKFP